MRIYLLRHGIAQEPEAGKPDSERALVTEGRKKLREVLRVAKAGGVSPSMILSSPYKRAVETADIAAQVLGYDSSVILSAALVPAADPVEAWEEVRAHKAEPELMLVGHEPLFGLLLAYLLGAPSMQVEFKKGALARVDMEKFGPTPRGTLRWMLPPKLAPDS